MMLLWDFPVGVPGMFCLVYLVLLQVLTRAGWDTETYLHVQMMVTDRWAKYDTQCEMAWCPGERTCR